MTGPFVSEGVHPHDICQTVQLSDRNGYVILHLDRPSEWIALDPATAGSLAEAMAKAAYKVYSGDVPAEGTKQLTERLRIKCRNRVELMLRSMAAETPAPEYTIQATKVVDAVFKEVG